MPSAIVIMPAMSLPQPPDTRNRYHYVPYDTFETDWLGDPQRLGSLMRYEVASINESTVKRYAPGTLVWVLLSKGKPKQTNNNNQGIDTLALHKKRRDKKNKRKNISESESASSSVPVDNIASESSKDEKSQNSSSREPKSDLTCEMINNHSRKEFFLRARVISDDEETSESERDGKTPTAKHGERRILVRYSRGATYRVRAYNLIPVLEPSLHNNNWQSSVENDQTQSQTSSSSIALPPLVVVVPETNIYRRVAKVHTTPDDSFMEIGCDYGITVDKIHKSLEEAGDVPKVWPVGDAGSKSVDTTIINEDKSENGDNDRVSCLGVDRSTESIDIANERYVFLISLHARHVLPRILFNWQY